MTNKRNRLIVIITVIAIVAVGWFAYSTYMFSFHPKKLDQIKIFSDFSELNTSLSGVTIIEEDVEDKHIALLTPVRRRCVKACLNDADFMLYAYEFSSVKDTLQYFKNIKGSPSSRTSAYLLSSPGKLLVIDEKNAYFIHADTIGDIYDIAEQLYPSFSKIVYSKEKDI